MPKAITQYKTHDGKVYANESDAERWERDLNKAKDIVSMFPNNSRLSSGDYYRIPMQLISDGRRKLADSLKKIIDPRYDGTITAFINGDEQGRFIGRLLDDGDSPFYRAWSMLECIDKQGRMFNQTYFTHHPEEAENEVAY